MSRGFITLGINTETDQIQYNYALACSIKKCDPNSEICLIVDQGKLDDVPDVYHDVFDYITELRFGNTAYKDGFHGMNLWQMYHCSPFDETVYIDNDTLFLNVDIDLFWQQFKNKSIAMPIIARTFRNGIAQKTSKFEFESHYKLSQHYSHLIYFDKSTDEAIEWFKMADPVFQNWRDMYAKIFNEKRPETFNKNVLTNIVTYLLNQEDNIGIWMDDFYDLDNRSQGLWHSDIPKNWTEMLNSWYTDDGDIIIENHKLSSGIIHYGDEQFITKEIIDDLKLSVTK